MEMRNFRTGRVLKLAAPAQLSFKNLSETFKQKKGFVQYLEQIATHIDTEYLVTVLRNSLQ